MNVIERGYSASWRVRRVDAATWLPMDEVPAVEAASVKRSTADEAPLMEAGELEVAGEIAEGYYRIEMLTGDGLLADVATLLFCPSGAEFSHGTWGGSFTGRSVLAPAAETMFAPGAYAPKGADAPAFCARLLRSCIAAPVAVEGSFALDDHVVFSLGDSYLDGIWAVLGCGGWCMQIAGDGTVTIREKPASPDLIISTPNAGILMPSMSRALPIEDVPNVLRVFDGDSEAEAVNDDPASPTSTVAHGRRIEQVEDSPVRKKGETLAQYAMRRLKELSDVYETIDVEREHAEGIYPYSVVRANLPRAGLSGDFRVMAQTLTCAHGLTVGETWGAMAWTE